jgi:hypothetical protein
MIYTEFDWNWPAGSVEDFFFFRFSVNFYSFAIISPWARAFLFIWKIYNSLFLRMICAKCGQNWPRRTDGRTDDRQQAIRKAHLSFQLRWTKMEYKRYSKYSVLYAMFCFFLSKLLNSLQNDKHSFPNWPTRTCTPNKNRNNDEIENTYYSKRSLTSMLMYVCSRYERRLRIMLI